jgi:hypothetical protein
LIPWVAVGAVPVQPSGSAPPREVVDESLAIGLAVEELPDELPVVLHEELLGHVELEEELVPEPPPLLQRKRAERTRVPDRQRDEPIDALGCVRGQDPGDGSAPVVPDDVRPLDAELVEHRDDVGDAVADRVRLDIFGLVGLAEPAQVGGEHAEPGGRQRRRLLAQPARSRKPGTRGSPSPRRPAG